MELLAYDWSGVYALGGVIVGSALVLVGLWLGRL
jgi:hypothetical protein